MIWETIRGLCEPVSLPEPYPSLLLIHRTDDPVHWLVGPYRDLTRLATNLRGSPALWESLAKLGVRLGLRGSDVAPVGLPRQEAYGQTVTGPNASEDFTSDRANPLAKPVRPDRPEPENRISDRKANVEAFWRTQTPQSHHIVEFNHLQELGVSQEQGDRELDYLNLPAVLLAAEFHQRYISSYLKRTHRWSKEDLRKHLAGLYQGFYTGQNPLLQPLWAISEVVLRAAEVPTS